MSMKMKFGSKDIPFVYKGDKLVYPNPIKDGLLLWYDFKGMKNTDETKGIAKDLSGNGNDGTLTNFNFTEESGYKDNTLVFDGVDDKLVIPELVLDETAMSVMQDGKLYAYEDDKVLTVGEDGEVVGGGRNLIQGGMYGIQLWSNNSNTLPNTVTQRLGYYEIETTGDADALSTYTNTTYNLPSGTKTTHSYEVWSPVDIDIRLSVHWGEDVFNVPKKTWTTIFRENIISTGEDQRMIGFRTSVANHGLPIRYRKAMVVVGDFKGYIPHPQDYKSTTLTPTSLTDLQLYNKTLDKTELLHNAESKGLKKLKPGVIVQDGLVLHYDFSHESNTSGYKDKAFDYSGNGNHGELQNFGYAEGSGYESKGLKFDGVDDIIEAPSFNREYIDATTEFNFDFSLNLTNTLSRGSIITMPFTGHRLSIKNSEDRVAIGRYTTHWFGKRTPSLNRGNNHFSINVILLGEDEYKLNEPNFLMEVYVNGELVRDEYASSTDYYSNIAQHLYVGWQGTNQSQSNNAYLDEQLGSLKIYNRPLSPEEIQHNYQIEKEKFNII